MRTSCLVFDLDGVLINSEGLTSRALRQSADKHGIHVPPSECRRFRGMRGVEIYAQIMRKFGGDNVMSEQAFLEGARTIYQELIKRELKMFRGAAEFVAGARRRFGPHGLVTSSPPVSQQMVFEKFRLTEHFKAVVTGADVQNGKPHPEAYELMLQRLGRQGPEVAVIEDSVHGVCAARAAGCRVVGITHSHPAEELWEAGAHEVVENFIDLHCLFGVPHST